MGAQPAAGGPAQPGGLGRETQLHPGAQSSGRHGEEGLWFTPQHRVATPIKLVPLPPSSCAHTHSHRAFTLGDLRSVI